MGFELCGKNQKYQHQTAALSLLSAFVMNVRVRRACKKQSCDILLGRFAMRRDLSKGVGGRPADLWKEIHYWVRLGAMSFESSCTTPDFLWTGVHHDA